MPAPAPLAAARGLTMSFGGHAVLLGVDLDLFPGEVHAITGENGAGKSTLAKLFAGIYRPTGGELLINGKPVDLKSPVDGLKRGVALVHQEPMTCNDLTVAENIFLTDRPKGRFGTIDWKTMNERSAQILETLGQTFDPKSPAGNLTLAGRQMIEVASALANNARVIILDETTAALSPKEVEELFAVVRRLRDEGCAIAFVSHRMDEVFSICDRITVLRDGVRTGEVKTSETTVPDVVRMMIGRDLEAPAAREAKVGEPLLEVKGLRITEDAPEISFDVRAGEIVVLAGLVGSGRTEVALALAGVKPPAAGDMAIEGKSATNKNPRQALRAGIALVPEDRLKQGIFLPLSIEANIGLPVLSRLGRSWQRPARQTKLADSWIERLAVNCRGAKQPIEELSGGNQQKVVLGKWLETEPRLLIVDEPTRGVDVGAKAEVHRRLRELTARGLAVLAVSSDVAEVLALADRVLVMREGRIVREFAGTEATEEAILMAATGQEEEVA